jgi:hypothetical protein
VPANLLRETWTELDSFELRLLLHDRLGNGHRGQFDGSSDKLYLPLARSSCRVALSFGDKIIAVEPGPAFDLAEWHQVAEEIENSILAGPRKIGRPLLITGGCENTAT